jgi:ethanolamine utilization protein EutJ
VPRGARVRPSTGHAPAGPPLAETLARAEAVILPRSLSESAGELSLPPGTKLRVGVDLGTAYLVLVVLDEAGVPVAGEWQFAEVVRDGLVVDFIGATDLLRGMKDRLERRLGRELSLAGSAYPPGVPAVEVAATAHVVEAAGFECSGLIDEPSAANLLLRLQEGALVDVGGGTTGIAVVREGRVVYTADEPTGGVHFTLVVAGSLGLPFEQAEALKVTPGEQARLLPLLRPVMEKVGAIILRHVRRRRVKDITLVGGTAAFQGMARVIQEYTGLPTHVPDRPLFVTPLGIALHSPPH